ncbi:MAG: tyrosine-type recombinase/integrase [Limisphaerales bacterium]
MKKLSFPHRLRLPLRTQSHHRKWPIIGPVIDDVVTRLQNGGYSPFTISNFFKGLGYLMPWLQRRHGPVLKGLTQLDLVSAQNWFQKRQQIASCTAFKLAGFFRERNLIPEGPPASAPISERTLMAHSVYLREMRGLAPATVATCHNWLRVFLRFLKFDEHPSAIAALRMDQIDAFLRRSAKTNSRHSLQRVVACLRGFLRHQHAQGILKQPLHQQIDTPRTYRLEQLPRARPWKQIVALLRSIDQSQPDGLRDFTMLYLAARYGLRSRELVRLTLDHIDWQNGTLQVPQSKTRQTLQLPLTDETGTVLIRYLQTGRPHSKHRELFLRQRAPIGALSYSAVSMTLKKQIRLSGLELLPFSARVLRHSLAVHLLRCGVPMNHIGHVLGHRDCESTSIYLRLAVGDLRKVGLPVPAKARPATLNLQKWKQKLPKVQFQNVQSPLATAGFGSFQASAIRNYLATRRALGRLFILEEQYLRRWDDFLQRHCRHAREVLPQMFHHWAQSVPRMNANTRRERLRIVRNFLLFYARNHPKTFVPDLATFPKPCPHALPRLVSPTEMARILATAKQLPPSYSSPLRAQTIRMALILLYCCGLRRGELLRLRLRHFDASENILRVEKTKFHKSRLIPLHVSVALELKNYLALRQCQRLEPDAPLIWSNQRQPSVDARYPAQVLVTNWQYLCLVAEVIDERGRPPRIHDLRHSFAVTALHRWYRQGVAVQAKLPHLATYLGHVSPAYTHHYLHLTSDLREAASQRFHQYAPNIFGHGGDK